jgi:hypothetical protein
MSLGPRVSREVTRGLILFATRAANSWRTQPSPPRAAARSRMPRGDVAVVAARPHPWTTLRPDGIEAEDAADHDAILQHVVVVIAPTT